MNFIGLIEWAKENKNNKVRIRELVRRDAAGRPKEGEIEIIQNLIKEIGVRAEMVLDLNKKKEKAEVSIREFFTMLERRGVGYDGSTVLIAPDLKDATEPVPLDPPKTKIKK